MFPSFTTFAHSKNSLASVLAGEGIASVIHINLQKQLTCRCFTNVMFDIILGIHCWKRMGKLFHLSEMKTEKQDSSKILPLLDYHYYYFLLPLLFRSSKASEPQTWSKKVPGWILLKVWIQHVSKQYSKIQDSSG